MTGRRVVVVGGGVAGLTTAYRLLAGDGEAPDVTVLEADERPGGKVRSVVVGGLKLEAGPDSFVARKPWAADLCRELGLGDDLALPGASGSYVWTDRGLVPFPQTALGAPADLNELLHWPGLSRTGRWRALSELVRKPRPSEDDESIGSLVRRRLGDEVAEAVVGPLLGGLFAGDLDRLSVRATFPELAAWERSHGSLIRGARAAMKAAPAGAPMFIGLAGGTDRLTGALVEAVGRERIFCGTAASAVRSEGPGYAVRAGEAGFSADAVVLAAPAFVAADVVRDLVPSVADLLCRIPYVSTGVVLLVYPEGTADALPEAAGFVVPRDKASMTACTWVSRKWPEEAFGDRAVLRCFVGGAGAEDVLDSPDEDIAEAVCRHLAAVLDLPPAAEASLVVRWGRAMPQYEVGHLDRVRAIRDGMPGGIFVVGSAYGGPGIPDCVREAGDVAERVRVHLAGRTASSVERGSVG